MLYLNGKGLAIHLEERHPNSHYTLHNGHNSNQVQYQITMTTIKNFNHQVKKKKKKKKKRNRPDFVEKCVLLLA